MTSQTLQAPGQGAGGYRDWNAAALMTELLRLSRYVVECDTALDAMSSTRPEWHALRDARETAWDLTFDVTAELHAARADFDVCDGCAFPVVPSVRQQHFADCTIRPFDHPTGAVGVPTLPDLEAAVAAARADIVAPFAGPGGTCMGAQILDVAPHRIIGIDNNPLAVQIARAAGYPRILASVRDLDPDDFAHCRGGIITPPCGTWTGAGLQSATREMQILREAIYCISNRCGCFWHELPNRVSDPRTALSIEPLLWALTLPRLQWLVSELTPAAKGLWERFAYELTHAEERQEWGTWAHAEVVTLDAADYGAPAHRKRVFLIARRYGRIEVRPEAPAGAFPVRSVADALGLKPGLMVRTRGNRRTSGGNLFSADKPAPCLTGKVRGWTIDGQDGYAFTVPQAGLLNGFPIDYPWDTPVPDPRTGNRKKPSRTAMCQAIADVVSPMVGAAVLGAAMNLPWLDAVRAYTDRIYPTGRPAPGEDLAGDIA
jgi:DNA (cytosine-5)-methyltransferase 1